MIVQSGFLSSCYLDVTNQLVLMSKRNAYSISSVKDTKKKVFEISVNDT